MIVIFDLDGTVWNSEPGILACMVHALDQLSLPVPTESVLRAHIGPPLRSMLAEVGVQAPLLDPDQLVLLRARALPDGDR